jgi:16S rRNA (cytidine1402-2'-O)-methyltransferase
LPADRFVFEGFLPHKKGRQKRLAYLASLEQTVVLYVSPHRVLKTLDQCAGHFGADRPAALSRELTKLHENTTRGTLATIKAEYNEFTKIKGELVLVIHGQN